MGRTDWSTIKLAAALATLMLLAAAAPDHALCQSANAADGGEGVPVVVWNRTILTVRADVEGLPSEDRAAGMERRLLDIPVGQPAYTVEAGDAELGKYKGAWIVVNGRPILAVLPGDAEAGQSFEQLKAATIANIEAWLAAREEQQHLSLVLRSSGEALLATLLCIGVITLVLRLTRRWVAHREKASRDSSRTFVIAGLDLRPYLISFEIGLYRFVVWGIGIGLAYLWLTFVLGRFPYSMPWSKQLNRFLLQVFSNLAHGIVSSIPGLFTVAIIFLLSRLVVQVVTIFFRRAEWGLLRTHWLEPETARATRRLLVALIWVFAVVVAYPYIPGSQTEAFKGVSVLLGLMVSLGSAGLVGQIVGGLVVVYAGAFRIGEFIRVGDLEGTVQEIGVLSTKLRTLRREEITIPNAVLMGTTTINYSRQANQDGAIVTTTVTIGYDTPWRQVHALLIRAAHETDGVRQKPEARVLQRALSDFYVEYQLLFHISKAEERYAILSAVHGRIQDEFNEHGVQIMSPHFVNQPAAPVVVARANWHAPPAPPEKPPEPGT